jgi:hypothetical protein
VSNPAINSILPSVLETLRAPVIQASKLIEQIQALLSNTDFTGPVNYQVRGLLSQLTDTLSQMSDIALPVPGLDMILDAIITPLVSLISLFGSLVTGLNEFGVLPKITGSQLNGICSTLQNLPAGK